MVFKYGSFMISWEKWKKKSHNLSTTQRRLKQAFLGQKYISFNLHAFRVLLLTSNTVGE